MDRYSSRCSPASKPLPPDQHKYHWALIKAVDTYQLGRAADNRWKVNTTPDIEHVFRANGMRVVATVRFQEDLRGSATSETKLTHMMLALIRQLPDTPYLDTDVVELYRLSIRYRDQDRPDLGETVSGQVRLWSKGFP